MTSREDIEWAAQAMREGRSLSYIASVLEVTEKRAKRLAFEGREANNPKPASLRQTFKERLEEPALAPAELRKALLRRRFAKHWNMIWFLRARRMSGRAIRKIYGSETLIWSVGGGIDDEIDSWRLAA